MKSANSIKIDRANASKTRIKREFTDLQVPFNQTKKFDSFNSLEKTKDGNTLKSSVSPSTDFKMNQNVAKEIFSSNNIIQTTKTKKNDFGIKESQNNKEKKNYFHDKTLYDFKEEYSDDKSKLSFSDFKKMAKDKESWTFNSDFIQLEETENDVLFHHVKLNVINEYFLYFSDEKKSPSLFFDLKYCLLEKIKFLVDDETELYGLKWTKSSQSCELFHKNSEVINKLFAHLIKYCVLKDF